MLGLEGGEDRLALDLGGSVPLHPQGQVKELGPHLG